MLFSITFILVCQLAGEIISRYFSLPVPGSVLGMVILIALLAFRERFLPVSRQSAFYNLEKTGYTLLKLLPLLFVPAIVGIIEKGKILYIYAMPIFTAIIVSTILTLVATVFTFQVVSKFFCRGDRER